MDSSHRFLLAVPSLLGLLACASGGDSSTAPEMIAAAAGGRRVEPVRFAVPRGETTTLTLAVAEDAECEIVGAASPFDLFADGRGLLSFGVTATEAEEAMPLDCTRSDGTVDHYRVDIAIAASPGEVVTRQVDVERPRRPARPALTEDPMSLSDEALVARGFPPPPNRDPATPAFAAWRELTQHPASLLTPHRHSRETHATQRPRRSSRPAGTAPANGAMAGGNWSGVVAYPSWTVTQVNGSWTVPAVTASGYSRMAEWVGLGGIVYDDSNNAEGLVQAGTGGGTGMFGRLQITTYDAWVEYYPAMPYDLYPSLSPRAPNSSWTVPVRAGDGYSVQAWLGNVPAATGYFWFTTVEAATGNTEYYFGSLPYVTTPGFIPCQGWSAEWIVEAPTLSMPNFQATSITNAMAYGSGGQTLTIGDTTPEDVFFATDSNGTMLDYPFPGSGSVGFWFVAQ